MNQTDTITIPKTFTKRRDLVIIPREEYELFLKFKKLKAFSPTLFQKKAIVSPSRALYASALEKLGKTIKKKYRGRSLPSLETQLKDLR